MSESVSFTLNGQRHTLERAAVEARLKRVVPEAIQKHGVLVAGTWFPVLQAFEAGSGIPRSEYVSQTARRHLAALGFEMSGTASETTSTPPPALRPVSQVTGVSEESWHTEANVQGAVVASLVADGWRILQVANTATKEHGIDVIATNGDRSVGIEVKGFPSARYADPRRAGEVKKTQPSTQAGHWFAQACLAAMRQTTKRPDLERVIALPDFPRYRTLYGETKPALDAAEIVIWWVGPDGRVTV